MNILKYVKSFVYESEDENVGYKWLSGLIFFIDEGKFVFDRGFIITGKGVSIDEYAFYANFRNFTLINDDLHYLYGDCIKKIVPNKVYMHIKLGSSAYSVPLDNLTYWNLFFSSPNNKIFNSLTIVPEKIKIVELGDNITVNGNKRGKIKNIEDIVCPLFNKRQVYNSTCVLFSDVNSDIF